MQRLSPLCTTPDEAKYYSAVRNIMGPTTVTVVDARLRQRFRATHVHRLFKSCPADVVYSLLPRGQCGPDQRNHAHHRSVEEGRHGGLGVSYSANADRRITRVYSVAYGSA